MSSPPLPPRLHLANQPPIPARPRSSANLWPRPKYRGGRALLDENDEIAALEAVRVALTEVGDGAPYVWHRAKAA